MKHRATQTESFYSACGAVLAVALGAFSVSIARERPESAAPEGDEIRPFKIAVDDAVLRDLQDRLARTRWPDQIEGTEWEYGVPLATMQDLVEYWRTGYDWRAQERKLNELDQFTDTMPSSTRIYFESSHNLPRPASMTPFQSTGKPAPMGFALFPKEINVPPRAWVERSLAGELAHWTEMPRGGHFAALEQPQLLADDVRTFFRKLR